jgi:hypothetical protein
MIRYELAGIIWKKFSTAFKDLTTSSGLDIVEGNLIESDSLVPMSLQPIGKLSFSFFS